MTDHKFTDDEVIKALELCGKLDYAFEECKQCPYKKGCATLDNNMPADALALINRQKAEIERLQRVGSATMRRLVKARPEAIKEFAERLKTKSKKRVSDSYGARIYVQDIDNLVKEMTERTK